MLYKVSGDHKRNYYLRHELQKVDTDNLIRIEWKKEELNFGEGGFDLEDHLQQMRLGRVAEQEQEEMEKEAEQDEEVDVYDLQRLADDLDVALKINIKSDSVAKDQAKIDKEYRRLKAIQRERDLVPQDERKNVADAKSEQDNRPIARRTGRVRKPVDRGQMVNTEADKRARKKPTKKKKTKKK